jgi:hypothetical protein
VVTNVHESRSSNPLSIMCEDFKERIQYIPSTQNYVRYMMPACYMLTERVEDIQLAIFVSESGYATRVCNDFSLT